MLSGKCVSNANTRRPVYMGPRRIKLITDVSLVTRLPFQCVIRWVDALLTNRPNGSILTVQSNAADPQSSKLRAL